MSTQIQLRADNVRLTNVGMIYFYYYSLLQTAAETDVYRGRTQAAGV